MTTHEKDLLTAHRRALHRIPEVDRDLFETNKYVTGVLEKLDCTLTSVVGTGILAYFDRGKSETVAFRSDMDALPMQETNSCDYASTFAGKMHACGHDGHMAMLLALAEYINGQTELPRNVLLIFQPAEETTGGAKDICDAGHLEALNVTALFGIHLWPEQAKGLLTTKPGPMMAQSNELSFSILGKSAHATTPEKGIDALYIGCRFVLDLYEMQKNEIPANERTILKIGRFKSGTVRNALSGETSCLGTMRAFRPEILSFMMTRMREIADGYEREYGCKFDFIQKLGYPPVVNDPALYEKILPLLRKIGCEGLSDAALASEDFSFYGTHVPSVFFFLGTGENIPLHSNNFDFDEEILLSGLNLYKTLLFA